jgi:hypothetical protein
VATAVHNILKNIGNPCGDARRSRGTTRAGSLDKSPVEYRTPAPDHLAVTFKLRHYPPMALVA